MSKFTDIFQEIKTNKENHDNGVYNCIPFYGMERLEKFVPGIEKATYYLLTASSGVGKSKLMRSLFIHGPIKYLKENPEEDIKLDIIYFSLEEDERKIILSEISKYLQEKHGLVVSIRELVSVGRYNTISTDTLNKIEEAEEYINDFFSSIQIIDNIRNPTGMFKYCRDFALKIGTYYDKNDKPLTSEEVENIRKGIGEDYKKISYYKTHHPNHYVIIVTDHLSLMNPESGNSIKQAIDMYSSYYCINLRNKFGFTIVNVQQQASDQEKVEVNYQGKTIEEKLEPSLYALGESKITQRDCNIALGLFAPNRYGIQDHDGYNIARLNDKYRSLKILKNRDGLSGYNMRVPLFFNGASDYFKELPLPNDFSNLQKVYAYVESLKN